MWVFPNCQPNNRLSPPPGVPHPTSPQWFLGTIGFQLRDARRYRILGRAKTKMARRRVKSLSLVTWFLGPNVENAHFENYCRVLRYGIEKRHVCWHLYIYVISLDVSKWFCLQKHVAFSELDGFWMDFLEFSQLFTALHSWKNHRFQPLWASASAQPSKSWMRSCADHPSEPTWFLGGHGDDGTWMMDGWWMIFEVWMVVFHHPSSIIHYWIVIIQSWQSNSDSFSFFFSNH